eukprot:tig00000525_g1946.t1
MSSTPTSASITEPAYWKFAGVFLTGATLAYTVGKDMGEQAISVAQNTAKEAKESAARAKNKVKEGEG